MRIPKDAYCQDVTVKRYVEGHYDENYQWVEGGEVTIATITGADIQPKSGRERAAQSGTAYESDYKMFAGADDIAFVAGYSDLRQGDFAIIMNPDGTEKQRFKIILPGYWGTHYEPDLKLEGIASGS